MTNTNQYQIKLIGRNEMLQVERLRYDIYVEEMSLYSPNMDQETRTISEICDQYSLILGCFADGTLVGSVTTTPIVAPGFFQAHSLFNYFEVPDVTLGNTAYTSRMVISPQHRNNYVSSAFIQILYKLAVLNRTRFSFIELWEDCGTLNYYKPFGFKQVGEMKLDPKYKMNTALFVLDIGNLDRKFSLRIKGSATLEGWENAYFRNSAWYRELDL